MKFELHTLDKYDEADLLSEVRRVSELVSSKHLTANEFDRHLKVHSSTVRRRFGGWAEVLRRAGIDGATSPQARRLNREELVALVKQTAEQSKAKQLTLREFTAFTGIGQKAILSRYRRWKDLLLEAGLAPVPLGRRYTEADCFENILNLWMHYGRQPAFAELNRAPSNVGSKAYVARWGGWRNALRAFIDHVESSETGDEPAADEPFVHEAIERVEVSRPRSPSLSIRYVVLCRDRFRCVICGRSPATALGVELHVDHIVPWSRGGTNDLSNLRTLCSKCNLGKGAKFEVAINGVRLD